VSIASEYGSLKKTYTSTALNPCFIAIVAAFSTVTAALASAPRPVSKLVKPRFTISVLGSKQKYSTLPDTTHQPLPLSRAEQALHRSSQFGGKWHNKDEIDVVLLERGVLHGHYVSDKYSVKDLTELA